MRARRVTPDQDPSAAPDAKHGTIGVVARDQDGNLADAKSSEVPKVS